MKNLMVNLVVIFAVAMMPMVVSCTSEEEFTC